MSSLNKVTLIGNLGKDPEVRRNNSGDPIVNLSVATSERWTDKQSGDKKEKTEWHRVVIFNKNLCDVAEKYLRKGSKIYLEGKLQTRKWTDKENVERYSTEVVLNVFDSKIVMLDGKDNSSGSPSGSTTQQREPGMDREKLDDDIPFNLPLAA